MYKKIKPEKADTLHGHGGVMLQAMWACKKLAASMSPPLTLWVNYHSHPLEYLLYTRGLQYISQLFHPLLNLMSISYHWSFVTAFYAREITYERSFDDFLCKMGIFLNVTPLIMETHYNHPA
jgi:hypothetical protein